MRSESTRRVRRRSLTALVAVLLLAILIAFALPDLGGATIAVLVLLLVMGAVLVGGGIWAYRRTSVRPPPRQS